MECPSCQYDNPEDSKFCLECGNRLELKCPNCEKKLPIGAKFCNECGQNLTLPSEPSSKDLSFDEKLNKIQRYLPKGLTEKILSQRDKIEGEHKQVTVMFCDMEGFTPLVEQLGAEDAYSVMDRVYELLIHKVHEYEGTVNEMTGDGIMALFGAPIALEGAPQRAIRSAYAIHRGMTRFSDELIEEKRSIPPLKMRIGIHSGPVVVGTLGNNLRVEFKAVGDTVNLASRMEGLAESGATYVTEDTFRLTEGFFRFEALGEREVKGRKDPVRVYRVVAPSSRRTRFDVSAEHGLTQFVGRERDLELLLDGFARAKEGRGQAISIMSEAGVGKSRLLYEFRKAVASENVTFLEGKCLSYSRGVAYHPVIDILKSTFEIQESDGDFEIREKVAGGLKLMRADEPSTLPYLLELLSVQESGINDFPLSPEARRERIIEALKRTVLKGSEIRPLVMAIEDLHWIDRSSEELCKSLLESISGARVFLIFTYRPEFVHTWGRRSYHNQVNLNRLSSRESIHMVRSLLGTGELGKDLEEFILEKTEGVPFFIEEFIKSLIELSVIDKIESRYQLVKDIKEIVVPSTIQDIIMARIDTLPAEVKGVLQTGSVIGRDFSHDLIQTVTQISEHELLSNLSVIKDAELVYERGIYPQSTYIFKHALTQEVAYNSLLGKRRKEIHEKIGVAIESLHSEGLDELHEVLAYHYSESDNSEKAYEYLKLSGDKTTRTYSNWEAFWFYKKAIKVLNQLPQTLENRKKILEIILLIATPMMFLAFPEDSLEILQQGENLCKEIDDKRSLAIVHSLTGICQMHKGKPLDAIKYSEMALEEPKKSQDIELMAPIGRGLVVSYLSAGEFRKITDVAPEIINLLEKEKRESDFFGAPFNTYSLLCAYYGISLAMLGSFEKGIAYIERGLRPIMEINHLASLGVAEAMYGLSFITKGDGRNAIDHFKRSIKFFEKGKTVLLFSVIWTGLGCGYYHTGDFDTAGRHIKKGLSITTGGGSEWWSSFHYLYLSKAYFYLDDLKSSQNFIEQGLSISQKKRERHVEGASWVWLGRILGKADQSQFDKAEECILGGIEILDEMKIQPWLSEGYLYLGELFAGMGHTDKAFEFVKKAEAIFENVGMDFWLARAYVVYADLHNKLGDRSQAIEHFKKATKIMTECGADGWAEKYEKELVALT